MGESTGITWTDHTFSPWIGCTKVSAGCQHCYAETLMDKRMGKVKWGPQGVRIRTSPSNWKQPIKWNRKAERESTIHRVFCSSLADVFEGKAETLDWLWDLGQLITKTSSLDWQLLTKRPENVMRLIGDYMGGTLPDLWLSDRPNVWIGTSVEDQKSADERIPHLLRVPATVRFLSVEPLLGEIDLRPYIHGINWVIVGGESGAGARRMDAYWVQRVFDDCKIVGIPFFFKQWGVHGGDQTKHHGGDIFQGQQWHEFPS